MDPTTLIQQYGLLAVWLGAFLEGETVLLLAGAFAHGGLLQVQWVMAAAAFGAFVGDSFFFLVGRRFGPHVTERFPWLAAAMPRIDALVRRWRWGAVIALRFMYGLRVAGPMLIGAGTMPRHEFLAANAVGAALWAVLIGGLGYLAGHAVEAMLGRVAGAEKWVVVAIIVGGIVALLVRSARRHRARPGAGPVNHH